MKYLPLSRARSTTRALHLPERDDYDDYQERLRRERLQYLRLRRHAQEQAWWLDDDGDEDEDIDVDACDVPSGEDHHVRSPSASTG